MFKTDSLVYPNLPEGGNLLGYSYITNNKKFAKVVNDTESDNIRYYILKEQVAFKTERIGYFLVTDSEGFPMGYVEFIKKSPLLYLPIFAIIFLLLVIAIIAFATKANSSLKPEVHSDDISQGELSGMNYEQKKAALQKIVDESAVNASLNVTPVFADDRLNIRYINRDINKTDAVLSIIVNSRTVYQSDLIHPGSSLENCTINKGLGSDESIVEAIARVDFFTSTGDAVNSLEVPIAIHNKPVEVN